VKIIIHQFTIDPKKKSEKESVQSFIFVGLPLILLSFYNKKINSLGTQCVKEKNITGQ
jgi:hypothetical protein